MAITIEQLSERSRIRFPMLTSESLPQKDIISSLNLLLEMANVESRIVPLPAEAGYSTEELGLNSVTLNQAISLLYMAIGEDFIEAGQLPSPRVNTEITTRQEIKADLIVTVPDLVDSGRLEGNIIRYQHYAIDQEGTVYLIGIQHS